MSPLLAWDHSLGSLRKKSAVLHGLIINPSLTKLFRWRWLDVSLILFLAFLVSGKKQKSKQNRTKTKPISSHLDYTCG